MRQTVENISVLQRSKNNSRPRNVKFLLYELSRLHNVYFLSGKTAVLSPAKNSPLIKLKFEPDHIKYTIKTLCVRINCVHVADSSSL